MDKDKVGLPEEDGSLWEMLDGRLWDVLDGGLARTGRLSMYAWSIWNSECKYPTSHFWKF
jgi:hypothetical protein